MRGAGILFSCILMLPSLARADDIAVLDLLKKNASLKLAPTTVQEGVDSTYFQLKQIKAIALAASLSDSAASSIVNSQLQAEDPLFRDTKISFSNQSAEAAITYRGSLSVPAIGAVNVVALLHAKLSLSIQVISDQKTTDFQISFAVTALDVQKISILKGKEPLPSFASDVAAAAVSAILLPAQAYLNRTRIKVPTTLSGQIDIRPTEKSGLKFVIDPKTIRPQLKISAVSYLMNDGRLVAIAQEGVGLNPVSPKPTNVPFSKLRDEFVQQLKASKADWVMDGQLAGYVQRDLLNRLTSATLGAGPICMNAVIDERVTPFDTKLKLPAEDTIDCTPTRDCTQTKNCSQNMECAQSGDCSACIIHNPFGGCTLRGNDPACEARKVAGKASCEVDKSRRKGQCEAEKATSKVSCEALKLTEKGACETTKEGYKRLRATGSDFANVGSRDLVLSGNASVCLRDVKFDAAAFRLTGKLNVIAHAHATGHIKFTPLNVVGHLTCFAPYEKSLNLDSDVPSQDVQVDTTAKFLDNSTQATISARIADPIHIRFPFGAIASKLFADPSFTITCPIPGAAASLRASTPDSWWPKQARGEIDRDLPDFVFNLDLVSRPTTIGNLQIRGVLRQNSLAIGGVFTMTSTSKTANGT